jgi:hypothetical protein
MKYILFLLFISVNINAGTEVNTTEEVKMNDQCGLQTDVPKESRLSNALKWKTASEQENFGYDIYRSDTEDGEFEVINEDTLEGAGTTVNETAYEFYDDNIDPCKVYYYYIESIAMNGTREAFTPKFPSKRKLEPKD